MTEYRVTYLSNSGSIIEAYKGSDVAVARIIKNIWCHNDSKLQERTVTPWKDMHNQ